MLGRWVKAVLEWGLRPSGYRLINPSHRFGIDVVADVARLSRLRDVDIDTIFDVGANVGRTTASFRAAWPQAHIIAFEPDAAVAQRLRDRVGGDRAIVVEQLALGAKDGPAAFFVHPDAPDLNSLYRVSPYADRFGLEGEPVTVDVATLDGFCAARGIGSIGLLKIDTEGSDYDVLRGAGRFLHERRIDFVYCEFNSLDHDPACRGSLLPIASLLSQAGYHFVASYNDYVTVDGPFFAVSNALFAAGARAARGAVASPFTADKAGSV